LRKDDGRGKKKERGRGNQKKKANPRSGPDICSNRGRELSTRIPLVSLLWKVLEGRGKKKKKKKRRGVELLKTLPVPDRRHGGAEFLIGLPLVSLDLASEMV